jgi:hypothetical protein
MPPFLNTPRVELVAVDETGDAGGREADIGTADACRDDRQPYLPEVGFARLAGIDDPDPVVGIHDRAHVSFSFKSRLSAGHQPSAAQGDEEIA